MSAVRLGGFTKTHACVAVSTVYECCSFSIRFAFLLQVMVEDSLLQIMQLPYDVFASGPYTPGCNDERVAYSDKLHLMDSKPDAQVAFWLIWLRLT